AVEAFERIARNECPAGFQSLFFLSIVDSKSYNHRKFHGFLLNLMAVTLQRGNADFDAPASRESHASGMVRPVRAAAVSQPFPRWSVGTRVMYWSVGTRAMVSALGLAMVLSSFSAGIQADNLPTNPSANPPGRPAQLFKPSDEPPLRDADACADTGDDLAPAMVVLPPGDFWMGSPDGEAGRYPDEGPSHWVTIPRPFAIGRCEVTVGQFKRFAEEKHYVTTAEQPDAKGCYTYDGCPPRRNGNMPPVPV
ncbi:MAG: SUMF1/EgtB/PvdO family nonheme iron enzyme, partial [Proteobacteria bacterium]|nr:SUMF1/EgtB/PvdO family nonheme iron enzyme [Pseudomonadota bacterium]